MREKFHVTLARRGREREKDGCVGSWMQVQDSNAVDAFLVIDSTLPQMTTAKQSGEYARRSPNPY